MRSWFGFRKLLNGRERTSFESIFCTSCFHAGFPKVNRASLKLRFLTVEKCQPINSRLGVAQTIVIEQIPQKRKRQSEVEVSNQKLPFANRMTTETSVPVKKLQL